MNVIKEYNALKDRIENISIYDVARFLFFGFLIYAVVDVCWKVTTHSQYDMERLVEDIQEYYPDSELTFQNIAVVDNDFKVSNSRGSRTSYQEVEHLYIRNGVLCKEPNFLVVLFLLPLVIIFIVFNIEDVDVKLKDLPKMEPLLKGALLVTLFITLFMLVALPDDKYEFRSYKNPKAFTIDLEDTRKDIYIDDYKK